MSNGKGTRQGPTRTPEEWRLIDSSGAGPFEESRAVYKTPEGYTHVWESRRNRKGRGTRVSSPWEAESLKKNPWVHFWAPQRISWWVAVIFVVGSALFTLAAAVSLFGGRGAELLASLSYFAGAALFTVGIYLQVLEGINAADYIDTVRQERTENEFRFFAWEPRRLAFTAPFVLLVGSLLFNLETTLAMTADLEWFTAPVALSLSSIGGSVLFTVASYLQLVEVCSRYLCDRVGEISWWATVLFILGSAGFVVGSVFGFSSLGLSAPTDELIVRVSFLQGSVLFLIGSYLLVPELFAD